MKKNKDDMSLTESLASLLPGIGKAFRELIENIGAVPEKKNGLRKATKEEELVEAPSMAWKKSMIKSYMDANTIKYNSGDTKRDLLDKIKWSN